MYLSRYLREFLQQGIKLHSLMVKFGVHSTLEVVTLARPRLDAFSQMRLSTAATSPFGRIKTLIPDGRELTLFSPHWCSRLDTPAPPHGTASACLPVRRGSSEPLALRCSTSDE